MTALASSHDVIERHARHLVVKFPDGHRGAFHHLWLRDNCSCPECLHPQTRERVLDSFSLDPDVVPITVRGVPGVLTIVWSDGHRTDLQLEWLREWCSCDTCRRPRLPRPRTWGAEIADHLPELRYADVIGDDAGLASFVDVVWTTGLCFVREVPKTEAAVYELARRVGHLRETNFGLDFHVDTMPDPNNVAFTSCELRPHNDAPNQETPPGIQFLLCLAADAPGGDSTLVDGFALADRLRLEEPEMFSLLGDVALPYRFHDDTHDLRWAAPVIGLNDDGSYREVRFHNALMAPFDLPLELIEPMYAALRRFHELATSDQQRITVRLRAGDLMVFHNRRVLHGRTAFDPGGGHRHLFGLYVDVDEWLSKRRMLSREGGPRDSERSWAPIRESHGE